MKKIEKKRKKQRTIQEICRDDEKKFQQTNECVPYNHGMESINAHGANSKRVCICITRGIIIIVMRLFQMLFHVTLSSLAFIPNDTFVNTFKRNSTTF